MFVREMKWYQREKTGEKNHVSKVMYEGTVNGGIDVLKKLFPKFFHCHNKDKKAKIMQS